MHIRVHHDEANALISLSLENALLAAQMKPAIIKSKHINTKLKMAFHERA
jgi:hypothetical protein